MALARAVQTVSMTVRGEGATLAGAGDVLEEQGRPPEHAEYFTVHETRGKWLYA